MFEIVLCKASNRLVVLINTSVQSDRKSKFNLEVTLYYSFIYYRETIIHSSLFYVDEIISVLLLLYYYLLQWY